MSVSATTAATMVPTRPAANVPRLPREALSLGEQGEGAVARPRGASIPPRAEPALRMSVAPPSGTSVDELVSAANDMFRSRATKLEFIVEGDPQQVIVRLLDLELGEVIREYSVKDALVLENSWGESAPGRLLSAVA